MVHHINRKLIATLLFSLLASVGLIIHGIFFDVDFRQIERLTLFGFLLTFVITFPTLLLLEWIFDLDNKEAFKELKARVRKLENIRNK